MHILRRDIIAHLSEPAVLLILALVVAVNQWPVLGMKLG